MPPSVHDNTKFQCQKCSAIINMTSAQQLNVPECPECGGRTWEQIRITAVCDFCSTPDPIVLYPCKDFRYPSVEGMSDQGSKGPWAACTYCAAQIEANDREALVSQAVRNYKGMPEFVMRRVRDLVGQQHERFFQNRTGPPIPVPEEET